MDGRKRTMPGRSLALAVAVAVAAQATAAAPCLGQSSSSRPESERVNIPPPVSRPNRTDPEVERTGLNHGQASSQQAPTPQAPPAYAPPAAYAQPAYAPPPYAMMVPYSAPAAATGNFFLPMSPPAAPPGYAAPQPGYMAQPAYMAAPMAAMAPAAAAVTGSSVSVPASSTTTSVEIRGPSLLAAGLARVGERLAQLGKTRIRTVQETVIQTPASQLHGGTATIATAGLTPLAAPFPTAPPVAPPSPPVAPPPPSEQGPSPSPQASSQQYEHSLLKHFRGRD